jgi:hypothetical protein
MTAELVVFCMILLHHILVCVNHTHLFLH